MEQNIDIKQVLDKLTAKIGRLEIDATVNELVIQRLQEENMQLKAQLPKKEEE